MVDSLVEEHAEQGQQEAELLNNEQVSEPEETGSAASASAERNSGDNIRLYQPRGQQPVSAAESGTGAEVAAVEETDATEAAPAATAELSEQDATGQSDEDDQASSTRTFDAIVNGGLKLVELLDKSIEQTPKAYEQWFTLMGGKWLMPELSARTQQRATDLTRSWLQRMQQELLKMGEDQSRMNQVLERTRRLENIAEKVLKYGEQYIPQPVMTEMLKTLNRLESLRRKS